MMMFERDQERGTFDGGEGTTRSVGNTQYRTDSVPPQAPELARVAETYARNSWPVFRCKPGGKAPAIKDGLKAATCDLAAVHDMWGDDTPYNIGMRPPIGVVVVDVDPGQPRDAV